MIIANRLELAYQMQHWHGSVLARKVPGVTA